MTNPFAAFLNRVRALTYPDPARDWLLSLITSVIVLAGIIVWNAWAFDTVARGGVIGSTPAPTTPIFSQSSLDTIHTIFENRAAEEAKYASDVYHFADPSL